MDTDPKSDIYMDTAVTADGKYKCYFPEAENYATDEFVAGIDEAATNLNTKAANVTKLSATFETEFQTYIDMVMKITMPSGGGVVTE